MDDATHMLTFASVVDAKGFAAAGKRLGLSASVVSKHVAKLEKSLGARLLNRSTRKLSLTEAGENVYEHCARLAAQLEAAEQSVAAVDTVLRGQLRVSAPPSMMAMHIAPVLGQFRQLHLNLELEFDLSNAVVDFSEAGFDMALRVTRQPASELISRLLAPLNTCVVAAPSYLEKYGRPETPAELSDHECLLFSPEPDGQNWVFNGGDEQRINVPVKGSFLSNVMEPMQKMAVHGMGVARLPSFMIWDDIHSGRLVQLLPDYSSFQGMNIFAVWPQHRRDSAKVREFVAFLRAHFGEEPYWDRALRGAPP